MFSKVVGYFKNKKLEKEKILLEEESKKSFEEREKEFNTIYDNVVLYSHLSSFETLKDILHTSNSKTVTDSLKDSLEHVLKGLSYKVLLENENMECLSFILKYNSFYTNSFINTVILSHILTNFNNCFELSKNELQENLKKENLINFLDSLIKCLNIKKDISLIKSNFVKSNFDIKYLYSLITCLTIK